MLSMPTAALTAIAPFCAVTADFEETQRQLTHLVGPHGATSRTRARGCPRRHATLPLALTHDALLLPSDACCLAAGSMSGHGTGPPQSWGVGIADATWLVAQGSRDAPGHASLTLKTST